MYHAHGPGLAKIGAFIDIMEAHMRGLCTSLIAAVLIFPQGMAQCVSLKEATFLVSDRYTATTEYRDYLVLANEFGLIYRSIEQPSLPPVHQEAVPGEITEILNNNDRLFLVARNEGVYIYATPENSQDAFPQKVAFFDIPEIQSAHVKGNNLFAVLADKVVYYRILDDSELVVVDEHQGEQNTALANTGLLFLHRNNGAVTVVPYTDQGFGQAAQTLQIDGETNFYGIYRQGELLILDTTAGVKWVAFNAAGQPLNQGFLYANADRDIVQGIATSDTMIALRFSDRIEIQLKEDNGQLVAKGTIPLSFTQLGFTKIFPVNNHIHLLNTDSRNRDWSLRSYTVDSGVRLVGEVAAQFGDIIGSAALQNYLYVGTEGRLYEAGKLGQPVTSLQEVYDLGQPLVDLIGTDSYIVAVTTPVNAPTTVLTWLSVDQNRTIRAVHQEQFTGSIEALTRMGDQVALLQHQRKTDGEHYAIQVISISGNGIWTQRKYEEIHPFQTPLPFRDLQLSPAGVTHHDGTSIVVHPDLNNLNFKETYQFSSDIRRLVAFQDQFWVETNAGLVLANPQNGTLSIEGNYDHWYDLIYLPDNLLLARSNKDRLPSRFHLLSLEDSGFVQSQVAFSMSGNPLLVNQSQTSIVAVEKNALNQFEMNCPPTNFNYLIPFASGLEMEINSLGQESDLITLTIFREDGQVIGVQSLSPEIISQLNGSELVQWLFDFNRDEDPFSFVLSASRPLTPVISGQANGSPDSRFAYTVPPWGTSELLVSHIPQNLAAWDTELFIRNFNEANDTSILLVPPKGNGTLLPSNAGGTQIVNVAEDSFSSFAPWARIISDNLETRLSGFSLYQDTFDRQAAAIPMVSAGSEFLILPNLIGETRQGWWTGLVLANTNGLPIFVRALGYGASGQILLDRIVQIGANATMVVLAESWLVDIRKREEVQWLAISAELPIVGMVLYGDSNTNRLSGLSLTSDFGPELQFSGIRSNDIWETDLQITNIGNDRGLLVFEAYDGEGIYMGLETREIPVKGIHGETVQSLFSSMPPRTRAKIQTVRVRCNTDIAGFMFRMDQESNSLEAASPWVQIQP